VVLQLPSPGRRSALRHREGRAERLGVLAGRAAEAWARQLLALQPREVLRLKEVLRRAASFRQPAANWEPGLRAAAHREVSWSRHLRRVVRPDAAKAPSVLRRQAASSSKAFRPEVPRSTAPLSKEPWSAVLLWWWAALPWGLPPVRAFRRRVAGPCAHRPAIRRQAASSSWQPEVSWLLPPAALSAWCARAVCRSQEAAVGSDARAAQPRAVPGASAQPPVAAQQEVSAAGAGLQRAAVRDVAEEPQRAAAQVEVLGAAAAPLPVAASAASQQVASAASRREAGPSAAPWAFRRDRPLPWPVRRRVARSVRATFVSQAASPSERSWQAARCEGLS
jgi:hypothetical protein